MHLKASSLFQLPGVELKGSGNLQHALESKSEILSHLQTLEGLLLLREGKLAAVYVPEGWCPEVMGWVLCAEGQSLLVVISLSVSLMHYKMTGNEQQSREQTSWPLLKWQKKLHTNFPLQDLWKWSEVPRSGTKNKKAAKVAPGDSWIKLTRAGSCFWCLKLYCALHSCGAMSWKNSLPLQSHSVQASGNTGHASRSLTLSYPRSSALSALCLIQQSTYSCLTNHDWSHWR